MIKDKQKFEFNNLKVEANWNKSVKPCKKIRFTIGSECAIIDKNDLYALLMLYGDDEQQEEALTVREMKVITKMMKVRCEKDFKKGDEIVFPVAYEVTPEVYAMWEKENKAKMLNLEDAKQKLKQKSRYKNKKDNY